jgi:hypothetical protein
VHDAWDAVAAALLYHAQLGGECDLGLGIPDLTAAASWDCDALRTPCGASCSGAGCLSPQPALDALQLAGDALDSLAATAERVAESREALTVTTGVIADGAAALVELLTGSAAAVPTWLANAVTVAESSAAALDELVAITEEEAPGLLDFMPDFTNAASLSPPAACPLGCAPNCPIPPCPPDANDVCAAETPALNQSAMAAPAGEPTEAGWTPRSTMTPPAGSATRLPPWQGPTDAQLAGLRAHAMTSLRGASRVVDALATQRTMPGMPEMPHRRMGDGVDDITCRATPEDPYRCCTDVLDPYGCCRGLFGCVAPFPQRWKSKRLGDYRWLTEAAPCPHHKHPWDYTKSLLRTVTDGPIRSAERGLTGGAAAIVHAYFWWATWPDGEPPAYNGFCIGAHFFYVLILVCALMVLFVVAATIGAWIWLSLGAVAEARTERTLAKAEQRAREAASGAARDHRGGE